MFVKQENQSNESIRNVPSSTPRAYGSASATILPSAHPTSIKAAPARHGLNRTNVMLHRRKQFSKPRAMALHLCRPIRPPTCRCSTQTFVRCARAHISRALTHTFPFPSTPGVSKPQQCRAGQSSQLVTALRTCQRTTVIRQHAPTTDLDIHNRIRVLLKQPSVSDGGLDRTPLTFGRPISSDAYQPFGQYRGRWLQAETSNCIIIRGHATHTHATPNAVAFNDGHTNSSSDTAHETHVSRIHQIVFVGGAVAAVRASNEGAVVHPAIQNSANSTALRQRPPRSLHNHMRPARGSGAYA
jgi:hypothetical protein